MSKSYVDLLGVFLVNQEVVSWLQTGNYATFDIAWAACPREDWLLSMAGTLAGPPESAGRIPLVLAACDYAERACGAFDRYFIADGKQRTLKAIEAGRAWARGEATAQNLQLAAWSASPLAYTAQASAASDAAAYAACAVPSHAASRMTTIARALPCLDIIRRHYPTAPMLPDEKAKQKRRTK